MLTAAACAPTIKAEGAAPHPLGAGGSLPAVVTRPRNSQQKEVYGRLDAPSSRFNAYAAVGQVYAADDIDILVQIWHPWEDLADLRAYKITLRSNGDAPVPVESVGGAEVTFTRSRLDTTGRRRTVIPIMYTGSHVGAYSVETWELGTIEGDLWRGRGRLRFRGVPLISHSTRDLTLELRNPRQVFVFRWHFVDVDPSPGGPDAPPAVATGGAGR